MSLLTLNKQVSPSADNWLNQQSASQNNGSDIILTVSYQSGVKGVSIMRFTVPQDITAKNFNRAELVLSQVGWEGIGDPPIENVSLKSAYLNNTGWTENGSTWNLSRAGTSWNVAGAYQSPDIITETITSQTLEHDGTQIGQKISINVDQIVSYAIETAQVSSFSISLWTETSTIWNYGSKENSTVLYRPYMIFYYDTERKKSRLGKSKVAKIPTL